MSESTDWGSALAILAAGLIVGMMFIYFFARRRPTVPAADLQTRDLEAKRDALIEQLRAEVSPDERTRLEVETAQVLRALDERKEHVRATPPPPPSFAPQTMSTRKAMMIGYAWGAGSVLALAGLAYFVSQAAGPRQDADPQTMGQPQQQQPADPMVTQLEATVRSSPDDLNARLNLAQAYLERENLMGVFEQTQFILARNPDHSRALTYQALVRMAMGREADAMQMLERATKNDPGLLDAWVTLAWVHTQAGRTKEAEAAMQEAMRQRPEEKPRLEQVLAQMRAHQNIDTNAPPQQAAPAGANPVRITLELDPSARTRTGVIYVIARAAGVTAGPPIAVKRVEAARFPLTVDLSSADSMMGQPLPARMRIEARLDSDGDAATRTPSDPSAAQDNVVAGATVSLALQ